MRVEFAAATHVGLKRKANEDSYLTLDRENLFVVADGMGGHGHGDVASRLAVRTIKRSFSKAVPERGGAADSEDDPYPARLSDAISRAHTTLLEEIALQPRLSGMGTTVVSALFANSRLYVAHVGDSRCYCLREGELHQLTRDHSLLNEFRDKYNVRPDQEAKMARLRHVISRALGVDHETNSELELTTAAPRPGDLYLLCSDGLSDEASDAEISATLGRAETPAQACKELIGLALKGGGKDNITAVVVRCIEGGMDSKFLVISQDTMELTRGFDTVVSGPSTKTE